MPQLALPVPPGRPFAVYDLFDAFENMQRYMFPLLEAKYSICDAVQRLS